MNQIKKFTKWCETNLPSIWGTLWIVAISAGSLALAIWTIKMLLKTLGLI